MARSYKLDVCGESWTIKYKPKLRSKEHGRLDGLCLRAKREIHIDADLPFVEQEETLLHELMHACLPEGWASKTEEAMIRRLSPRLYWALEGLADRHLEDLE